MLLCFTTLKFHGGIAPVRVKKRLFKFAMFFYGCWAYWDHKSLLFLPSPLQTALVHIVNRAADPGSGRLKMTIVMWLLAVITLDSRAVLIDGRDRSILSAKDILFVWLKWMYYALWDIIDIFLLFSTEKQVHEREDTGQMIGSS